MTGGARTNRALAFLLERQIIRGVCDLDGPIGIGVIEDRRPFRGGRFAGGAMTGSQARGNAAFTGTGE